MQLGAKEKKSVTKMDEWILEEPVETEELTKSPARSLFCATTHAIDYSRAKPIIVNFINFSGKLLVYFILAWWLHSPESICTCKWDIFLLHFSHSSAFPLIYLLLILKTFASIFLSMLFSSLSLPSFLLPSFGVPTSISYPFSKSINTCKLNNTLLINQCTQDEIKDEIRQF